MAKYNYEADIQIDPESLDLEWLEQPSLMMKYSKRLAQAELEVDNAKERLDLVKAELDNKIRTNPQKFGFDKSVRLTETMITSKILSKQSYKDAMAEYLQLRYEAKVISGAVRAIDHRKSALENMVRLHGQQYFAGPSVPRDLTKEWTKKQDQRKIDASIKIKRRT